MLDENIDESLTDDEENESSSSGGGPNIFWSAHSDERTPTDNKIVSKLAEQILAITRVGLKAKGYEMEALSAELQQKIAKAANLDNANPEASNDGGGVNTLSHPDLAFLGGKADKTILPMNTTNDIADALGMDADALQSIAQREQAKAKRKHKHKMAMKQANRMEGPKNTYKAPPPRSRPLPKPNSPV